MIDLDNFNQDIDHNYTASEILRERAPQLLYELQWEFYQLHVDEGNIKIEPHTGNEYWVEDY
tara:strand:- start:284 stop:469 length:186 start_codon:yes stop_codon:yes gene_type:complete